MNLNIKTFLTLGSVLFSFSMLGADECEKSVIKQIKEDKDGTVVHCVMYSQPKENRDYISMLETYESDEQEKVRIRHYLKDEKKSLYQLIFSDEDLGEAFLPLSYDGESSFLQVLDMDGDGNLEVAFRTYIVPSALVRIHKFSSTSDKIETLGMIDNGFQVAEFYPFIVSNTNDEVVLAPKSITLNGVEKSSYSWKENAFTLDK